MIIQSSTEKEDDGQIKTSDSYPTYMYIYYTIFIMQSSSIGIYIVYSVDTVNSS